MKFKRTINIIGEITQHLNEFNLLNFESYKTFIEFRQIFFAQNLFDVFDESIKRHFTSYLIDVIHLLKFNWASAFNRTCKPCAYKRETINRFFKFLKLSS